MSVQITDEQPLASAEAVESTDDLLIEIFLKLPLRSLLRFKFVSARWQSIIVGRVLQLLCSPVRNLAVGLFLPSGSHGYEYLHLDVKIPKDPPFTEKLRFEDGPAWPFWIQQSCNGLLLCCSSCKSKNPYTGLDNYPIRCCYVYNPTTKDFARLPRPGACDGVPRIVLSVNLAFDPCKSPVYKAVCVKGSKFGVDLLQVEVYSVESDAWRSSGSPFRYAYDVFCHGVYWSSSIHWMNLLAREILCFNVDEERFRMIPLPADMNSPNNNRDDSVGYFGESCDHLHIVYVMRTSLNVYEMKKDYSEWFVKYRVDMGSVYAGPRLRTVLCLTRGHEGSFLFVLTSNSVVIRCDLESNSFVEIVGFERAKLELVSSGLYRFQYIESAAQV